MNEALVNRPIVVYVLIARRKFVKRRRFTARGLALGENKPNVGIVVDVNQPFLKFI